MSGKVGHFSHLRHVPQRFLFLRQRPWGAMGVVAEQSSFLNWLIKAVESQEPSLFSLEE